MSAPDQGRKGPSTVLILIIVLIVLVVVGGPILVACIGIVAAIAIPNFVQMQYRAKRAEVPANVDGIKTAELAYDAAFDSFIPVSVPAPRPITELDGLPVSWVSSTPFDDLGWGPDGQVRGIYWVEVAPNQLDFVVHGMCDIDRDGIPAHYTATKSINATMVTDVRTY